MARTTLFTDDFNRADSTDLGANWDASYTSFVNAQIVGNRARTTVVADSSLETVNAVGLPGDQWAQVTLTTWNTAEHLRAGVVLRAANSPTVDVVEFQAGVNTGSWTSRIAVRSGGSISTSSQESATTWAAGDILRAESIGTQHTLYRNGVLILSHTDGAYTSGKAGIDFIVLTGALTDLELDDFSSGGFDLPQPPPFLFRRGARRDRKRRVG